MSPLLQKQMSWPTREHTSTKQSALLGFWHIFHFFLTPIEQSPFGGQGASPIHPEQRRLIESMLAHRSEFWLNEYHLPTRQTYASREKKWSRFCEVFGFSCLTLPTQIQYELFGTWLGTVAKRGDGPFKKSSFQQYMRHMATVFEADFPPPALNVARSPISQEE
jgi:hypothetical protein